MDPDGLRPQGGKSTVSAPPDVEHRILDAGRVAGSSRNTQKWEFVVVSDHEAMAQCVYAPGNVLGAALVVALDQQRRARLEGEGRRACRGRSIGRADRLW
mgnify:CR=1 FL=1